MLRKGHIIFSMLFCNKSDNCVPLSGTRYLFDFYNSHFQYHTDTLICKKVVEGNYTYLMKFTVKLVECSGQEIIAKENVFNGPVSIFRNHNHLNC